MDHIFGGCQVQKNSINRIRVREAFSGAQRNNTGDREAGGRFSLYGLGCQCKLLQRENKAVILTVSEIFSESLADEIR